MKKAPKDDDRLLLDSLPDFCDASSRHKRFNSGISHPLSDNSDFSDAKSRLRQFSSKSPGSSRERPGFWDDERGQISAEMLIIIAALIGVAIVLINQLQTSAKTGAKNLNSKTDAAWKEIDQIGK